MRPRTRLFALALAGASLIATSAARADHQAGHYGGYFTGYHAVSDGTLLMWQAFTPNASVWGPGPYPIVVDYSGYEPATAFFDGLKDTFLGQGYAVAGVNVRGTGCSGGKFDYFEPVQWQDGAEMIDFLGDTTKHAWSNGDVAMVGKSYPGITPLYVAAAVPKAQHLRAIVPGAFFGDLYRDIPYPGGILNSVFAAGWSFGSQPANSFEQWSTGIQKQDQTCIANQALHVANPAVNPFVQGVQHQWDDDLFHQRSSIYYADRVDVPVFAEIAWQDEQVGSRGLDWLTHLRQEIPWRAVVTNGDHGEYYGNFVKPEIFRFLSYYLKKQVPAGDACAGSYAAALACYQAEPRVLANFETGPGRVPNWQQRFPTWPVTNDVYRLNLHEGGLLSGAPHGAAEQQSKYVYQFPLGSNSYGTTSELPGDLPFVDYWQVKPPQGTVATFTTPAFTADTLLAGTASADLWLSSTAPDTDLEVMLTELRPDPSSASGWSEQYVQKGWLRASHRILDDVRSTPLRPYQTHQLGDFAPLIPGQPAKLRVEIFPFAQLFRAGTKLRLTIEAPTTLPELWGFAANPAPAVNFIWTDAAHPSSLALPFVSAGDTYPAERACGTIRNQPCRPADI